MSVDIYVIVAIEELMLEGLPVDGLPLEHDCIITPDHPRVLQFVDLPLCENGRAVREIIGEIARNTIAGAAGITFIEQESEEDLTEEQARRFLLRVITLTHLFLLCLWLTRDNSGNTGDGILALGVPGAGIRYVYTQRPGVLNFTATSERRTTAFTRGEIDRAAVYFHQLDSVVLPQVEWKLDAPRPTALTYQSRIFRTLYFTQAARASADVAVRAMYYSMAFEALLSAETGRYSHNVPRRVSQMLATTKRGRQQPYNDIYALYGYRSDVVHGSTFEATKLDEIRQTTERCDGYLRRVLTAVLNDETLLTLFRDGTNRQISQHFNGQPPEELPERARPPGT